MAVPYQGILLSNSHVNLLFTLSRLEPTTVKALARELEMTPGAVSQLFDGLKPVWFERRQDETDRRNVLISLSSDGQEVLAHLQRNRQRLIDRLSANFSESDLATIHRFLNNLRANLAANRVKSTDKKGTS